MEPTRTSPLFRVVGWASVAAAAAWLAQRDWQRRGRGIPRRSLADIMAEVLTSRLRNRPTRWLASFIVKHKLASYLLGVVVLFLLFKYQQFLRRWMRRISRNFDPSPGDALEDYPTVDDPDSPGDAVVLAGPVEPAAATGGDVDGRLPTVHENLDSAADSTPSDRGGGAATARQLSGEGGSGSGGEGPGEPLPSLRAHSAPFVATALPTPTSAYSQARGVRNVSHSVSTTRLREMEKFMRMMRTTIQGLDADAVISIYEKLDRLNVPSGGVVFREGDDSEDGMYIVVSGDLALHGPTGMSVGRGDRGGDMGSLLNLGSTSAMSTNTEVGQLERQQSDNTRSDPHASALGPVLCTFSQAQTVGENSLLAGTCMSRRRSSGGGGGGGYGTGAAAGSEDKPAPYFDCRRPGTLIAATDSVVLRLPRSLFLWFTESFPHAVVSFVLTTTTRQWRVAYYLLVDFLHLRDAWLTALEPPGHAPPFKLIDSKASSRGGSGLQPHMHIQRALQAVNEFAAATPSFGSVAPSSIYRGTPVLGAEPIALPPPAAFSAPPASVGGASSSGDRDGEGDTPDQRSEGGGGATRGSEDASRTGGEWQSSSSLRYPPAVPLQLSAVRDAASAVLLKQPGEVVYTEGSDADSLYLVLSGHGVAHVTDVPHLSGPLVYCTQGVDSARADDDIPLDPAVLAAPFVSSNTLATRRLSPGCIAGGVASFVGTPHRDTMLAVTPMEIAVFPRRMFTVLSETAASSGVSFARASTLMEIALAVSRSLVPLLRMSLTLGLQRLWLRSGEVLFREGEAAGDGMYVIISGRLRTSADGTASVGRKTIAERAGVMADGRLPSEVVGSGSESVVSAAAAATASFGASSSSRAPVGGGGDEGGGRSGSDVSDDSSSSDDCELPLSSYASASDMRSSPQRRVPGLGGGIGGARVGSSFGLSSGGGGSVGGGGGSGSGSARGGGGVSRSGPSRPSTTAAPTTASSDAAGAGRSSRGQRRGASSTRSSSGASRRPLAPGSPTLGGNGGLGHNGHTSAERESAGARTARVDVGRGETVGELSVLVREKRRAISAVCIRDCELVRVSQASFELISTRYPAVMNHFTRVLAHRYQQLTRRIAGLGHHHTALMNHGEGKGGAMPTQHPLRAGSLTKHLPFASGTSAHTSSSRGGMGASASAADEETALLTRIVNGASTAALPPSPCASTFITIAVVGAGGVAASIADFTSKLVRALERTGEGSVLHVTSTKVDLILGEGTAAKLDQLFVRAKVGAWLSAQEEKHRFVVFEADPSPLEGSAGSPVDPRLRSGSWRHAHERSYLDLAKSVVHSVSSVAGKNIHGSLRTVGRGIDSAVRAGIGISPSSLLSRALGSGRTRPPTSLESEAAFLSLLNAGSEETSHSKSGPRPSPWTNVCVQQADLCLLVGQAHTAPDLSVAERECVYRVVPLPTATPSPRSFGTGRGGTSRGGTGSTGTGSGTQSGGGASSPIPHMREQARSYAVPSDPFSSAADLLGFKAPTRTLRPPTQLSLPFGSPKTGGGDGGTNSSTTTTSSGGGGSGPTSTTPSGGSGDNSSLLSLISRSFCAKELVLLHPDPARRPSGTRNWLRLRRVSWHHHVRTWYEEDYDRIARHICGKARGVVLGGGGSRGLAHLGVLQVMAERKIGIDVIGGTSQGAFMAACYALTLDTEACVPLVNRLASTIANKWTVLTGLTLPIFSYFSGTAFNDALMDNFKDTQIEDLWIKYFCVSTDVTNDTTVVHQTGPLWRYCRASMTVMGLLPPLWDRGRLLIDGGYTNNLPVEVLRSMAPQVNQVVCVDVENKDNSLFEGIDDYGESLSGWYIAWKWVLSLMRIAPPLRIPPLSEVALKVSYISHSMMIRNLLKENNDNIIYIRPDVGTKFKLLDYHLMPSIVQMGVEATRETLDRWEMRQQRRILKLVRKAARLHVSALRHAPTLLDTQAQALRQLSRNSLAGSPTHNNYHPVGRYGSPKPTYPLTRPLAQKPNPSTVVHSGSGSVAVGATSESTATGDAFAPLAQQEERRRAAHAGSLSIANGSVSVASGSVGPDSPDEDRKRTPVRPDVDPYRAFVRHVVGKEPGSILSALAGGPDVSSHTSATTATAPNGTGRGTGNGVEYSTPERRPRRGSAAATPVPISLHAEDGSAPGRDEPTTGSRGHSRAATVPVAPLTPPTRARTGTSTSTTTSSTKGVAGRGTSPSHVSLGGAGSDTTTTARIRGQDSAMFTIGSEDAVEL